MIGMKKVDRQRELLTHSPHDELDRARKIEMVRRASQTSSDPFSPNNTVLKALVDNGLGITPLLHKLVR